MAEETSSEMLQMMKTLSSKFDTLQADVDRLKRSEEDRSSGAGSSRRRRSRAIDDLGVDPRADQGDDLGADRQGTLAGNRGLGCKRRPAVGDHSCGRRGWT